MSVFSSECQIQTENLESLGVNVNSSSELYLGEVKILYIIQLKY